MIQALTKRGVVRGPGGVWTRGPEQVDEPVTREQLRWLNEYFTVATERQQTETNSRLKFNWIDNFC